MSDGKTAEQDEGTISDVCPECSDANEMALGPGWVTCRYCEGAATAAETARKAAAYDGLTARVTDLQTALDWQRARAEKAEARVAELGATRDELRASWPQCTRYTNECLGGCASLKEHDAYRYRQLQAQLAAEKSHVTELEAERDGLTVERGAARCGQNDTSRRGPHILVHRAMWDQLEESRSVALNRIAELERERDDLERQGRAAARIIVHNAITKNEPFPDQGPCAQCMQHKPLPYRRDDLGGYVCLTCVEKHLDAVLDERDAATARAEVWRAELQRTLDEVWTVYGGLFDGGRATTAEAELADIGRRVEDVLEDGQPATPPADLTQHPAYRAGMLTAQGFVKSRIAAAMTKALDCDDPDPAVRKGLVSNQAFIASGLDEVDEDICGALGVEKTSDYL